MIVETLSSNGVFDEENMPHPSPPFQVGVFVVFFRKLEQRYNIA